MYKEIQLLHRLCLDACIPCVLKPLFDGYKLLFADGSA